VQTTFRIGILGCGGIANTPARILAKQNQPARCGLRV